jgi:hypothetical protein
MYLLVSRTLTVEEGSTVLMEVNICAKTKETFKKEQAKLSQNPSKKTKQPTKINQIKQNTQQTNTVGQFPQVKYKRKLKHK